MSQHLDQAIESAERMTTSSAPGSPQFNNLQSIADVYAQIAQAEALTRIADSIESIVTGIREEASK